MGSGKGDYDYQNRQVSWMESPPKWKGANLWKSAIWTSSRPPPSNEQNFEITS